MYRNSEKISLSIALVNLLKFFVTSEDHLLPKYNVFLVSDEVSEHSKTITASLD